MTKKIKKLITELLNKTKQKTTKETKKIQQIIKQDYKTKNVYVEAVEKGTLFLKTKNPTWRMEVSLIKEEIKKKLIKKQKTK